MVGESPDSIPKYKSFDMVFIDGMHGFRQVKGAVDKSGIIKLGLVWSLFWGRFPKG
jgi:hypothetical protein